MPKPTFDNLAADKRERIIDAAIEEFAAHPYAKATLDRIVERAGVSKGSMYQYFEGKADLYRWLVGDYLVRARKDAITPAITDEHTVWEALEQMFLAGLRSAAVTPRHSRIRVRFVRDHALEPELAALATQLQQLGHEWMMGFLKRGQERGEVRADVDVSLLASLLMHAMGEGLLTHIARRFGVTFDELLDSPERLQAMSDDEVRAVVREVTALFEEGAGGAR